MTLSRTTDANLECAFFRDSIIFIVAKIGEWGGRALPPFALPFTSSQTEGGKREAVGLFTSKVHAIVHHNALTFKLKHAND